MYATAVAGALIVGLLATGASQANAQERFEVAAWLDHFDFAGLPGPDGYLFDSETVEGCGEIISHVEEVGTTTVLWRNCAGSTMRYPSEVEGYHQDIPLDKRRVPDTRPVWGWVHYGDAETDLLQAALDISRERDLKPGVHWPFEEAHGYTWTFGGWNMERPQFWCRSADGHPWAGRASIGYPEVMEHRLNLLQELIDRGMESLFIDFFRTGGWTPALEYVEPVVDAWREKHGTEPPTGGADLAWAQHVSEYVTEYLRAVRERLDASGRKIDLMVGIPDISAEGNAPIIQRGADWRAWIDEGLIDALVIVFVRWDTGDPFESTRRNGRAIMDVVDGRVRVLWPVRAYDFGGFGMPSYERATGLGQAEIAERLMRMAWEEGAAGISLECVDYNNYRPDTRRIMYELAQGPCRYVRTGEEE